ncbi:MAG: restriction endonuclease subunit S [Rhodopirellula sp.]|nr:restriction endonuclease subunit S [Rhodopirellula sp.]
MSNGWHARKLNEVGEITMGTSSPGNTYNAVGEGMPLINGPVEFSVGSFGKTIRSKFTSAPNKLCKENDLILCVRGSTTGRMNIADFDACIGRGVAAIRAKEYQPWINWFIRYKRDDNYDLGTGSTFPNITSSSLANLAVLMPPLPEQRRIVGILDEAFVGIATAKANAEKNLQNARALFESGLDSAATGKLTLEW